MLRGDLGQCFLEYIRIKENNNRISYSTKLQEFERGAETNVYWFQLGYASPKISKPLVLRVYKEHSPQHRAIIEGTTQNYLADKGYPAPRVHYTCTDSSRIGAPFIVMDYVPGEMLGRYNKNVHQTLAELSIKLHKIDPEPLRQSLQTAGIEEKYFTGLTEREQYIYDNEIGWLLPGLEWIHDNKPRSNLAVVHGDIHANNIIIDNGSVSGVLDWAGLIDDNIRDVASTKILYTVMAPSSMPHRRDEFRVRAEKFLELYSSSCVVDPWKLEYYEAVRCFSVLVDYESGFENVRSSGMHIASFQRFREITGIHNLSQPW